MRIDKRLLIEKDGQTTGEVYQNFMGEARIRFLNITKRKLINRLLKNGWTQCPNKLYYTKDGFYVYDNKLHRHIDTPLEKAKGNSKGQVNLFLVAMIAYLGFMFIILVVMF